jgi:hypothetical protein
LPQLDSEVVNPTGFAENKGLIVSSGKRLFAVKKTVKQEAVDCIAIIKRRRTGVHSSLEVSLHKDNKVLGKQITAGQLTIEKAHKDANT